MKQAFWFGLVSWSAGLLALAWPLLLSFVIPSPVVTVWVYVLAIAIDMALFIAWCVLAIRYSRRAGQGDLFDVPWVVRLTGASSYKR